MRETECVEVLLATYNGERFIRQQLDSILRQSDSRWHLTVSDDGSVDQTPQILDEYVAEYPQKITRYRAPRRFGGARDHFFHLMDICDAQFMLFCDQDDVWYADKIQKMMNALGAASREYGEEMPLLVFSDQTVTDAALRPLAPSLMRYQKQYFKKFDWRSILMQNVVTGGAMGINRALARLAGQCTRPQDVIMHDWWLAAVAARFGHIVYIDEPLGDYRQHEDNNVGAKDVESVSHTVNRLLHLSDLKESLKKKKGQAAVFELTYQLLLVQADLEFLRAYAKKHSGITFYWRNRALIHGFWRLTGAMLIG